MWTKSILLHALEANACCGNVIGHFQSTCSLKASSFQFNLGFNFDFEKMAEI